MKRIFLDHASTTKVDDEVIQAMLPYFSQFYGNPSSIHTFGREAREAVDASREHVGTILGARDDEIIFTAGGTESDNLAIKGIAYLNKEKRDSPGPHIITSVIEHPAVLETCKHLEKQGFKVDFLPVDKYGMVDLGKLEKAIRPETVLVSVMYANNEVGTIQPLNEISKIVHSQPNPATRLTTHFSQPVLHTDAAATAEYLDLDVKKLGVDLMTLGSHKFGGPKGVGILYIKKDTPVSPITFGGHHESGLWPGTEAVPLIVGMTKALELSIKYRVSSIKKVAELRDKLISGVLEKIPDCYLTGHPTLRLPDITSFVFKNVEGEAILLRLDAEGIAASSGSACTSGDLRPSHVLLAMGIPAEEAHGSIRFSLGRETTEEEIDYVLEVLPRVISDLRNLSKGI